MKTMNYVLAAAAVAAMGLSGIAEARDRGDGHGARPERPAVEQPARHRSFDQRVDRRLDRQQERIHAGRASGDLTRREAGALRDQYRDVARMDRRFSADGHYSSRERKVMERSMDRLSDRIRWARNNHHYPGNAGHHRWRKPEHHRPHPHHYRERVVIQGPAPGYGRGLDLALGDLRAYWNEWGGR